MTKFSKKKGLAIVEYALIAALFAMTLGIAVYSVSPGALRSFFIWSAGDSTSLNNGTLKMNSLGGE